MILIIWGHPVGKPRMTRSDAWKQRPCVMKYWAWCDVARSLCGRTTKIILEKPTELTVRAFFQSPKGKPRIGPHTVKPDGDNVLKAVADALFENDQMIYRMHSEKFWAATSNARVEVEWQ